MTKHIIYILIIAVLAVILLLSKFDNVAEDNVVINKDTTLLVKIKGIEASINKSIEVHNQNQLQLLAAQNDTLKKLISHFKKVTNTVIIKERFELKHDTIPFGDTIPCEFKPIPFAKTRPTYSMFGRIDHLNLFLDSLIIPNEQTIVLGDKRRNFFGTERQIAIVNSNPLISTKSIQNITIKEKKQWFERPLIVGPIGIVTGVIIKSLIKTRK